MNSKAETIINESDIDYVVESIYSTIRSNIKKPGSDWIIESAIDHSINISKYNPLACSSYVNYQKNYTIQEKVWPIFKIFMIMNALNSV